MRRHVLLLVLIAAVILPDLALARPPIEGFGRSPNLGLQQNVGRSDVVGRVSYSTTDIGLLSFSDLLVDPDTKKVFISAGNREPDVVFVLDLQGRLVTRIRGFEKPSGLAIDGDTLYVANIYGERIDAINKVTYEKVGSYPLPEDVRPHALAYAGERLWFSEWNPSNFSSFWAVEPTTGLVTDYSDVPMAVTSGSRLAATPSDPSVLISYGGYQEVRRFSVSGAFPTYTGSLAEGSAAVAFSPDGTRFLATGRNTTTEYSSVGLTPTHTYPVGFGVAVAYSDDGTKVGISTLDSRKVMVYRRDGASPLWSARMKELYQNDTDPPKVLVETPEVRALQFHPDGKGLFAIAEGWSGRLYVHVVGPGAPTLDEIEPRFHPLRVTRRNEAFPSAGGRALAWTSLERSPRVQVEVGGRVRTLTGRRAVSYTGGLAGSRLIYQTRKRPRSYNSVIKLYDWRRRRHLALPGQINTPHFEFLPSMSGHRISFGRFSVGRYAYREELLIFDRRTRSTRVVALDKDDARTLSPGQLSGRFFVWNNCYDRCEVRLYDYRKDRRTTVRSLIDPIDYAPAVTRDGYVFFATSNDYCGEGVKLQRSYRGRKAETLLELPRGEDISGVWAQGKGPQATLYISIYRCLERQSDLYKFKQS